MSKFQIAPVFFLLLLILGTYEYNSTSTSLKPSASNNYIQVQLLGVNDFHGQLNKYQSLSGTKAGGAEYLAAYLKQYKQETENTLLVHAGDMVGGSPPISSLFQDQPTIELLNLLNFDVGTLGNHEFDEGVNEMKRLIHGGFHEKTGTFPGSNTSYCSANVIDKKTGTPLLPPYVIKQINGINIGFIGVVTTETNQFVLPEIRKEVKIIDEVSAINQTVELLKEKGIKSIVVLAHVAAKSDLTGTNPSEDLAEMAPKIDDEVDVIFGGHNHKYANTEVDGKLIVQSYSYGKAFSQVKLSLDRHTKDIVKKKANIIVTSHHQIEPDEETITLLNKYKEKMDVYTNTIVGEVPEGFARKQNPNGESPLAQIVAESGRTAMESEIAFVHHGGIRASLKKGEITIEDLYTALPFNHSVVKLTLTGDQIKRALEQQWMEDKENILQTAGLTYNWNPDAPIGSRILVVKDLQGKELQPNKEYTIAVSNYLASGGDGFTVFKQGRLVESGPLVVSALKHYIQQKYPREVVLR
ncbi:bifunctional metallophosphatase/5'-nucleotidase [Peribacillus cavernae]|uniref:bifunctional metallophosphatase/5'-nucleotidase n=1 Tax=Peribacillus cavernae TaxID=1674310 RepID=UPI00163C6192|nr:bifunctional metallophosphatase/5'-nucleotidase [Peribacillus cavernae]MDQ0218052.1 5'-nucleotidase [Peribacillus cavernae]